MRGKAVFSVGIILALIVPVLLVCRASPQPASTSATGTWSVTYSGNALTPGTLVLRQVGQTVVASYGRFGHLDGKINYDNPYQVDVSWSDGRGTGWATFVFNSTWNAFVGRWGFPAAEPVGTFVAKRVKK